MAADYLPEGFAIYQMRAEYKRQALLGDVFYPAVKVEEKNVTVALSSRGWKALRNRGIYCKVKMIYVKIGLNQDTLVIDYYHPAVHYPNRVNYYALMAICDVARKKYGI